MALTDRVHNSGHATNPGRKDPRSQVADIDDLLESVGGFRRENTTTVSQPSLSVAESVAQVTGSNDQSWPRDEDLVADTGSAGTLSGHLRLCIVGRAIRLGTLSRLDRLSCLDSFGLIIPSVRGYRRHHGPVARTVGERVQGRFEKGRLDQVQLVGELDELVPLAVQPVIGAS